jgi:hypothetical protein
MRLSRKEFQCYMENWDEQTRTLLTRRMEEGYSRTTLEHFSQEEALLLKAVLERLIPGCRDEAIDLVGFVDWSLGRPLGRGDRREGLPGEEKLFRDGLSAIRETAQGNYGAPFQALSEDRQDQILTDIQEGTAKGDVWKRIPSPHFFTRLLSKALVGYCAHPLTWMRMGFPGPSFPEGYVWISEHEIQARREHFPGWKTL